MEEDKLKIECIILAQAFEIVWAYYLLSSGHLFEKECRDSARKFLEAFDELAEADGQIKNKLAVRLDDKTDIIIAELRRWTEPSERYPFGDAGRARLTLWDFFAALKKHIVLDLRIKRFPETALNFGELVFSTNYVKWRGHLPRVALWNDPDALVQQACSSPTIVLVGDIRRSHDLMTYAMSPDDFSDRLEQFITTAHFTVEEYGGFFDKFTGDRFIAYFNQSICKVSGYSHIDGFLGFLRKYSDFATGHLREWVKHVKKLPDYRPMGLALGADLGTISLQKLNEHVIAVGDAIVWASRLASVAEGNEILVNNLLYEALRNRDGLTFEDRAATTKSGEGVLARALSFQKPDV